MIGKRFEDLTKEIWTDIRLAHQYGTFLGEETITDSILLKLAKQHYFSIRILQTPKPKEAIQGTDWEWFVGSYRYGWIRYAIQAKKINPATYAYDKLNHKVGKAPHDDYQINILRKFSTANGAVPLYHFYNYFPTATKENHWQCHNEFDKELLGWTFTTLSNVEAAIKTRGSRTFDKIHRFRETVPVRCLFTCPYFKSLYRSENIIGSTGTFLGESFRKVAQLPNAFLNAREIGILGDFPEELYSPEIQVYPKRIAIIELPESDIENI